MTRKRHRSRYPKIFHHNLERPKACPFGVVFELNIEYEIMKATTNEWIDKSLFL